MEASATMPLAAFPKCFVDQLCVHHSMSAEQWIEMSASLDIDGLEFYWPFTPWRDPAELQRLRRLVEAQGRSIPMMCYSPDFTHPDPAHRRAEVDAELQAIRICPQIGVRFLRVLSGQRRPGVDRADGIAWVAEAIDRLLPEAERQGITLILENHYKDSFWEYPEFAQHIDVFLELLEAIPHHPNFGVNYDPSNAIIAGDDPIEVLLAVKGRVRTMHASDRFFEGGTLEDLLRITAHPSAGYAPILRHGVIGKGLNNYDLIFNILKETGFTGWISIEDGIDPEIGMQNLANSADFLRRKMADHGLQ